MPQLDAFVFQGNNPPLPFSPCGKKWRAAPDEGCGQQAKTMPSHGRSAFGGVRPGRDVLRATPHPAFGHLLPQREKEKIAEYRQ